MWRTGWKAGDTLLMFESGIWGTGHEHFDKNQFLLEAFGERMALDAEPSASGALDSV